MRDRAGGEQLAAARREPRRAACIGLGQHEHELLAAVAREEVARPARAEREGVDE